MNLLALAAALVLAEAAPPSSVEGMAPVPGRPNLLVSGVPEDKPALGAYRTVALGLEGCSAKVSATRCG